MEHQPKPGQDNWDGGGGGKVTGDYSTYSQQDLISEIQAGNTNALYEYCDRYGDAEATAEAKLNLGIAQMDANISIDSKTHTITINKKFQLIVGNEGGYTKGDAARLNKLDDYLNGLGLKTTYDNEEYSVKFEIEFLTADQLGANDVNLDTFERTFSDNKLHPTFLKEMQSDGTTRQVGGLTDRYGNILMNKAQDNRMNRIHEIFHSLGMRREFGYWHGPAGIMAYPPQNPNQNDIDFIIYHLTH